MRKIFCLGSGSSMGGFDWSRLDGEHTIGCNRVFLYYPLVTEVCFVDRMLWDDYEKELREYRGKIWCNRRAVSEENCLPNMERLELSGDVVDGVVTGGLTGAMAYEIACLHRPDVIYLLGYDLYPGHFYDVEDPHYTARRAKSFNRKFWQIYMKHRIPTYNCNLDSHLRCFDFRNISVALGEEIEIRRENIVPGERVRVMIGDLCGMIDREVLRGILQG